jgi:multicomponent Na+:H+ antiporter subunit G
MTDVLIYSKDYQMCPGLTAPVAAHMIARAAYSVGTPLWEGTIADELRGQQHLAKPPGDDCPAELPKPLPTQESDTR